MRQGGNEGGEMETTITAAEDFATATRTYLELKHWSQDEFARKIGRSTGSVSEWLAGKRVPPLEIVFTMEDVLGRSRGTLARYLGHDMIVLPNEQSWEDLIAEGLLRAGVKESEDRELAIRLIRKIVDSGAEG